MTIPPVSLPLSGDRLKVLFHLRGSESDARAEAQEICVEQTIEFPAELVPAGDIHDKIIGQIESFRQIGEQLYAAVISFSVEITGYKLTQLINVLFGNISLKPGIRLERIEYPESLLASFKGPRFGVEGLRDLLGVPKRPLLCTALKPMGLSATQLAELAYQFALGGMDMIKDDHSLADQSFAPFDERVQRCAEAVARANRETGQRCLYLPNVTSPADKLQEKARRAKQYGAGGFLVSPGIVGLDAMRTLADDDGLAVPIMTHPAFQGSFVTNRDSGISHYVLFGQIPRLAGADATIFPNYGGRFSFSKDECREIVDGSFSAMDHLKPIFPTPGGGMSLERVGEMYELYGKEVIFLIGGGLHKHSDNLTASCRYFRSLVEQSIKV